MDGGSTVTKAEAARQLKVSRGTLDTWIASGVIATTGSGVDRASLEEVAVKVERLRESGKNRALLAEALNCLEQEDPGFRHHTEALLSALETDDEFVSAAPGADWDPED